MNKQEIGSIIAKSGFKNEHIVANKFNDYLRDEEARQWLEYMGYDIRKIEEVQAVHIPPSIKKTEEYLGIPLDDLNKNINYKKADIQVQIEIFIDSVIYREHISIKKVTPKSNFNQIDKRKVEKYKEMWDIPDDITLLLKYFTGEVKDSPDIKKRKNIDYSIDEREQIEKFLNTNKIKILSDILRGRGGFSAEYMIVSEYDVDGGIQHYIIKIVDVLNKLNNLDFIMMPKKTTISLGEKSIVSIQRKGGTPDPESLQFKFKPLYIKEVLKGIENNDI